MTAITVVVSPTGWGTMIAEEHHASMITLRSVSEQVECRIVIEQEVVRSASLRSDDVRTLDGIATEEDREIQTHDIVVALAGVEFDGKASWIPGQVGKLASQGHCRVAKEDGCLRSESLEKVGLGQVRHVLSRFEMTESTTTARVDHPLKELVTVESLLLLEEEDVRSQWQAADGLAMIRCWPWDSIVVGVVRCIIHTLAALDSA
jgi:hypothetical protein